jgi:hypothetical protein
MGRELCDGGLKVTIACHQPVWIPESESYVSGALRILIVDDEIEIRRFLRASLSAHGNTVFEAACGGDALQMVVDNRPDLLILDWGCRIWTARSHPPAAGVEPDPHHHLIRARQETGQDIRPRFWRG